MLQNRFYKRLSFLSIPARLGMVLVLLMTALGVVPVQAAPAALYTVNSTNDLDDSTCDGTHCSLREAIDAANGTGGADTINFSVTGTIYLNSDLPQITGDVTITGPGPSSLTVDGQDSYQPFDIAGSATVTIFGLTITNGEAPVAEGGGGIRNAGTLTVEECVISYNSTESGGDGGDGTDGGAGGVGVAGGPGTSGTSGTDGGNGGGISNSGTLTVTKTAIHHNTAGNGGTGGRGGNGGDGGDNNFGSGGAGGSGGNAGHGGTGGDGGGIYNSGTLTLTQSAVYSNTAGNAGDGGTGGDGGDGGYGAGASPVEGGAGGDAGTSGDGGDAGHGGGIYNSGTVTMINSTISGNTAGNSNDGSTGGAGGTGGSGWSGADGGDGGDGTDGGDGGDGGGGGGVYNTTDGTLTLNNSTINSNNAGTGGVGGTGGGAGGGGGTSGGSIGIGGSAGDGGTAGVNGGGGGVHADGTVNVKNTILSNNTIVLAPPFGGSGPDCSGTINSQDYNLIESISGCIINGTTTNNITGQDPVLGPLQDNGGETWTHALMPGSPALDQIPDASCDVSVDQRSVKRPWPNADENDIGAYENGPPDFTLEKSVDDDTVDPGQPIQFTISANNVGDGWAQWGVISDTEPISLTFGTITLVDDPYGGGSTGTAPQVASGLTVLVEGDDIVVTIDAEVDTCPADSSVMPAGSEIVNTAWITSTHWSTPTVASVMLTVNNVAPVATNDNYNATENTPLTVNEANGVLYNGVDDSDANCDSLTAYLYGGSTTSEGGTVALSLDGSFTYTPPQDYCTCPSASDDSFQYRAYDGTAYSNVATVYIDVACQNNPPNADDDTDSTNENTSVDIDVLANDDDADRDTLYCGDTLTVDSVTQPVSGTVTNNTTNVNFDPDGDFEYLQVDESETVTFTYIVIDDTGGLTDTATVTVTVDGVNDAPVANPDYYETDEDTVITITAGLPLPRGVLYNDTDVEGDTLTVVAWEYGGNTANGDVSSTGSDGSFTYDPRTYYNYLDDGEEAVDDFDYRIYDGNGGYAVATVYITVTGINDPPDADDDLADTPEDTPVTIDVRSNDTDPEDNTSDLVVISVGTSPSGTVENNNDGTVTFTPTLNFSGTASFTYTIQDSGGLTDTATVYIEVGGINDCPTAIDDNKDDGAETDEDSTVDIDVLANDVDPDSNITVDSVTQPVSGTVTNNTTNVNFDPDGDFDYLAVGESTTVTFTYIVDDGECSTTPNLTNTATVTVTVNGVNNTPVANDDSYTVLEDNVLTSTDTITPSVLDNDSDVDTSDTLTASLVSGPSNGTLTLNEDGTFVYTPTEHYFGSDSFTYEVSDGNGGTDNGTVNITVTPVNDVPSFTKGADVTVDEDYGLYSESGWATNIYPGPTTVSAPYDESAQTVQFNVTNNTNSGLFSTGPTINPSGDLSFTPANNACGSAQITIELEDDGGTDNGGVDTSPSQTFTITVTCINDAPSFNYPDVTRLEDSGPHTESSWATPFNAGPSNESGQSLTFTVVGVSTPTLFSAGPTVANDGSGDLSFTPAADMYGSSLVTVTLQDDGSGTTGGQDTVTHTFTIYVTSVNDQPTFNLAGTDVIVDEDSGPHTESNWFTDIYRGPTSPTLGDPWDERGQSLTYHLDAYDCGTLACGDLFATLPDIVVEAGNPVSGNLTFKPAENMYGVALVSVYITDTGGTTNGGVDTSVTKYFTITIRSVNDEPAFDLSAPHAAPVSDPVEWGTNAGPYTLGAGFAENIDKGPDPDMWDDPYDETPQEVTFILTPTCSTSCGTGTCGDLFSVLPAISGSDPGPSGTLTFTPSAGCWGTANITVTIQDDGGTALGGDDKSDEKFFVIEIAQNARPIAEDDDAVTDEATPVEIPVMDNDWDPDDGPGPLSITIVGTPEWGEAVISSTLGLSDTVLYTPTERPFTYVDVFTYTINDTLSDSFPANVYIVVGDAVDREVTPLGGGGLSYTSSQTCTVETSDISVTTEIEVPGGAVEGTVALVYSELPLDMIEVFLIPDAPPGLGFTTRLFQLDVYSNAIRQEVGKGFTFTVPIVITLTNECCQGGMTLSYWDERTLTWSEEGITVLEEDVAGGRLVAEVEHLGLIFALACRPYPPVGGHTEPVSPVALFWPWLLLAAMVITGAVATAAFRRRTAHR